jgi:hypothetical protein
MANPPIGNCFIEGPIGVCRVRFNGVELGKTLDVVEVTPVEDIKEILHAQDGTQPYDYVPTGQGWSFKCKMTEPTWLRIKELMRGITVTPAGTSAKAGRDMYRLARTSFAKELILTRVDSDGVNSTNALFVLTVFLAFPKIATDIGQYGPDNQRAVEVEFIALYHESHKCFWYSGYGSSLDIT